MCNSTMLNFLTLKHRADGLVISYGMHPTASASLFLAACVSLLADAYVLASPVLSLLFFFGALLALGISEYSQFVFDFANRRILWSRSLFFRRSSGVIPLSDSTRAQCDTELRGRYRRPVY